MTNINNQYEEQFKVKRIGGYLHRIVTIIDKSTGKVVNTVVTPFSVELRPRDMLQIIVGATILAIPVGLTEETWKLAKQLPFKNIIILSMVSLFFVSLFVYFNFYRFQLKQNLFMYFKRIVATYCLSLLVVGLLLTIIQQCPWGIDNMLAIKRIILTAFPASMAATVSDTIK